MTALRARTTPLDLDARLKALEEVVAIADGRLERDDVERAASILERAGQRLRLSPEHTVVALGGATGGGKSSLFNALAGQELSPVGVRRPTTAHAQACVWGADSADPLLDWLGVPRRHRADPDAELDGLVLLDLPDHDSTEVSHRLEVDRLVDLVDVVVWVVDPQKYADAALYDRYLRSLAEHASVMVVVLNHADRLDSDARAACRADLRKLLELYGLGGVPVLMTSARTGEGVEELRGVLCRRVAARRAAVERLGADLDSVTSRLATGCSREARAHPPGRAEREALVEVLADAAGVNVVADAVAKAHRHRAATVTGWPFTRWLRRLRPDPLRRFHLDAGDADAGRSSLPPPSPVQRARVGSALRRMAEGAAGTLPDPWRDLVRNAATAEEDTLPDVLDRAVTTTNLGMHRTPAWWSVARALQALLAVVAVAGALWLGVLFVIAWLRLPDPPVPEVRDVPLPTLLLIGGLLAGLIVAIVCRQIAAIGARRRKATARRRLVERVGEVADDRVLAPVRAELSAHDRMCEALQRVGGGRSRARRSLLRR